jgi:putative transposase
MKQYYSNIPVEQICWLFGKTRQAWYDVDHRQADFRLQEALLLQWITELRNILPRMGGLKLYVLIQDKLEQHHIKLGRDGFFNFLRKYNLLVQPRKKYVRTTRSSHHFKKWPNLIEHTEAHMPEQIWVSDITYLRTENGFIYLFLITDAWSRKITGFHLSQYLKAKGCISALLKAIHGRQYPSRSLIHHSDRGIQYCCDEYVQLLQQHGISISMTLSGSPYDNAIAERVNGILKQEFNLDTVFKSYDQAIQPVARAVHIYNTVRPHFSCGLKTPEMQHLNPYP